MPNHFPQWSLSELRIFLHRLNQIIDFIRFLGALHHVLGKMEGDFYQFSENKP